MANKTVIMYWDCEYCGTKNISGLERDCPYCGKPRGTDTNFHFIEGKEKEYLDEETAESIGKEPDWLCSYCSSLNNAKETSCPSCGASREDSSKNYFEMKKEREAKKALTETDDYTYETIEKDDDLPLTFIQRFSSKIYVALLGLLLVFALIFAFVPKTKSVFVDGHSWHNSINIEENQTFHESDWQLPPNARLTSSQVEFKEFVPVLDHYETEVVTEQSYEQIGSHTEYSYIDNGNGTATEVAQTVPDYGYVTHTRTEQVPVYRDEAIYATKYYYDIDRWVFTRAIETEGNDTSPYWGELVLKDKERESKRVSTFTIHCSNEKGKEFSYEAPYDIWIAIKDGTNVKLKISLGVITEVK